ncbi:hypothetical protein [Paenibacillus monticola]|nr:hypothetical protein [Paenibacillus monticola]
MMIRNIAAEIWHQFIRAGFKAASGVSAFRRAQSNDLDHAVYSPD